MDCAAIIPNAFILNQSLITRLARLTLRVFFAGFAPLREPSPIKGNFTQRRQGAKIRKAKERSALRAFLELSVFAGLLCASVIQSSNLR